MMKAAGLDWTVAKKPLYYHGKGGKITQSDAGVLIRESDDKVLTILPDTDWNECQNSEAFAFFNDFVKAGEMTMHTAGSLSDGKRVWALAKVQDSFSLFDGKDEIDSYLLFSNPHQYGASIDVRFTPIRVVCNNTLTMALGGKVDKMVKVSHRTKFDPEQVKEALGIAHAKLEHYKESAEFLAGQTYDKEKMVEYFNAVFPKLGKDAGRAVNDNVMLASLNARRVYDVLESQPGANLGEGTYWQLYNAVTYHVDHRMARTDDARLTSAWFGQGAQKKIDALKIAVEMAKKAA
jgi:phage/plasmid-like protein (TIGR03299 family)